MAFLVDEAFLPATLTVPPMTDKEFADFCSEHPDLWFEVSAEGELIVMPPTRTITGVQNAEILKQLANWARQNGTGIVTDAAAGFVLPNGARRSPDAAWTPKSEVAKLPVESREGYWHLCPAFAVELRSASDRLKTMQAKMREYIENGAKLGWLIDPQTRSVEIYRPDREPETVRGADRLEGEGPVEGFVLQLDVVWEPLGG